MNRRRKMKERLRQVSERKKEKRLSGPNRPHFGTPNLSQLFLSKKTEEIRILCYLARMPYVRYFSSDGYPALRSTHDDRENRVAIFLK
jgi:hypothetical protein